MRHRLLLVVRDDDEGEAELLLQAHQLEARALAQLAVERRQRLVEQQELGPLGQRAGQRHALALAARELRRPALAVVGRAAPGPAPRRRAWRSRPRQALAAQAVADVARHVHVREEGVGLEHHVDRPAVRRHAGHVLAVDQDAAARRASRSPPACAAGWSCRSPSRPAARRARRARSSRSTPSTATTAPKRLLTPVDADDRPSAFKSSPVLTVVHSRVRSRVCSALPAVMV